MSITQVQFEIGEDFARNLDESDPLRGYRNRFHIPKQKSGEDSIYLCGNSLGLMPKDAEKYLNEELEDWGKLAVDAHFEGRRPWYSYHEILRDSMARLVGAQSVEVVMMNSLTVNLHLMMVSFYQPTETRYRILIESPAFPSDMYAVQSHIKARGVNKDDAIIEIAPRENEHTLRIEDIDKVLEEEGDTIALVLYGGVNFFTGQLLDMESITKKAHEKGCMVGFDLAHAAGNVELKLHDWDVDFACWCTYKYLNSGPGAVAGCFVHEKHAQNVELPRFGGWWGNDPETRFRMQLEHEFVPVKKADGWQLSNPPIMALAPVRASFDIFDEAGMDRLIKKSAQMFAYLRFLIEGSNGQSEPWFEIITPPESGAHGCQLSILVNDKPRDRFNALTEAGVVCDFREPNVIRIAPVPLYNTFYDCWKFAKVLKELS